MAQRKKILVIDDDAAACDLIEQTLEEQGLEVITIRDARAGFETAKTLLPDLIFINLLLPGINGLKFSKAIHSVETLKTVPVIMIVAQREELDPKYTTTIGIVDILVKPLTFLDIITKTKAVLGESAFEGIREELITTPFDEEEIAPVIVIDEDEVTEDAVLAAAEDDLERPHIYGEHENREVPGSVRVTDQEGEAELSEIAHRSGQKEGVPDERDLFSEVLGSSGDDMTTTRDEDVREPEVRDVSDVPADDYSPSTYEAPASPFRRGLIIASSIIAGIALGIGGYLFFTAGTKHAPAQKQVTKVLPGPATASPAAPASPAEKPKSIPEIPVKQEPPDSATAKQKESKLREPVPAKGKPAGKPAGAQKQPAEKAILPADTADTTYYVQAGVFGSRDNAAALVAKIKDAGFAASIKHVSAGKKTLYRVIAGTYASHNKAVEMSESLNRKGFKTIVRRQ